METNKKVLTAPFMATHPTAIIKDEIKARGMSQKELAERMEMKTSNLSRLLKGENITPAIAAKLEAALDIPATMWLNLQAQYDKDIKAIALRDTKETAAINTERMLSTMLNLPELYKRLDISASLFIQKKLQALQKLLGFKPLEIGTQRFATQFCYKKSNKHNTDEKNQNTWLTLAYIKSKESKPLVPYTEDAAREAALEISKEVHTGALSEAAIKNILHQHGIAYTVVEKLEKTPIDAVAINMDDYPAIVTTHRYNDMSRLVFNVLHELGHIAQHMNGTDTIFISSDETYSTEDSKEKEANKFAEDMLIAPSIWKKMMNSETNGISSKNIINKLKSLSKENHLDFNVVVWRYKYESHTYNLYGAKPVMIR